MKVRDEIEKYASEADKPALLWLFDRYHWASQWSFVAHCKFQKYGEHSYQVRRVWTPSMEGNALFAYATWATAKVLPGPTEAAAESVDWWVGTMRQLFSAEVGSLLTLDQKRAAGIALKVADGLRYDAATGEWTEPDQGEST
jgi:hypothetical protein